MKWLSDAQWKGLLSLEMAFPEEFTGFPQTLTEAQIRISIGNETIVSLQDLQLFRCVKDITYALAVLQTDIVILLRILLGRASGWFNEITF